MTARPRILVTNDDGIESRGLLALKQALEPLGEVLVIAPETNQSAVGHSRTMWRPLRVRERTLADGSPAWSIDGSPSDAVGLVFLGLLPGPIDLVASGINHGANLGNDITYSGTVSAAMEAVLNGCPAFAISHDDYKPDDFELAMAAARVVARAILARGLEPGQLLNVNVPAIPLAACEGFEVARLGKRTYQDELIRREDPRGVPYYWVGGSPPDGRCDPRHGRQRGAAQPGGDHADPAGPDGRPLPGAPARLGADARGIAAAGSVRCGRRTVPTSVVAPIGGWRWAMCSRSCWRAAPASGSPSCRRSAPSRPCPSAASSGSSTSACPTAPTRASTTSSFSRSTTRVPSTITSARDVRGASTGHAAWASSSCSPTCRPRASGWYLGTADAVRYNLHEIDQSGADTVLILGGDHVYKMDYRAMVAAHHANGADVTIAVLPVPPGEATRMGICELDSAGRVVDWEEKPAEPRSDLALDGRLRLLPGRPSCLAVGRARATSGMT